MEWGGVHVLFIDSAYLNMENTSSIFCLQVDETENDEEFLLEEPNLKDFLENSGSDTSPDSSSSNLRYVSKNLWQ